MAETDPIIVQAGAIAVKTAKGIPQVLVIRAKKIPADFIFPKGHVESGESLEETAVRELEEEGGIAGKSLRRAGELDYRFNGKRYHVTYFVIRYSSTVTTGEPGRDPRWCSVEEALGLLAFPELRELLKETIPHLYL